MHPPPAETGFTMQTGILHAGTVLDTEGWLLANLSGLSFHETSTGWTVMAVSAGEGGLTRLSLDAGTGALSMLDQIALDTFGLHGLVETAGGAVLLDRYDTPRLAGTSGSTLQAAPLPGSVTRVEALASLDLADGTHWVAWSVPGQPGLGLAHMSAGGAVLSSTWVADDGQSFLGDVRAIDLGLDAQGRVQVVAGSGRDSGVSVLRETPEGGFAVVQDLAPSGSFSHYQISTLERVETEAGTFVLAGASMSGSISVFAMAEDGTLAQTDHLFDTRDTRFGGVDQIAVEVVSGRILVAAGGADRGVTLFELDTMGTLHHLATVVDDATLALDDLSGLELLPADSTGEALLVTGAARDSGISVLRLDLEALQPQDTTLPRLSDMRADPVIADMPMMAPAPMRFAEAPKVAPTGDAGPVATGGDTPDATPADPSGGLAFLFEAQGEDLFDFVISRNTMPEPVMLSMGAESASSTPAESETAVEPDTTADTPPADELDFA